MNEVNLYTDGACSGNPGLGGCACILKYGENKKVVSAGFTKTTNNRMELMAAILGLEAMKRKDVKIVVHSDSKYVTDSFNKGWIYNWEKEDFNQRTNADLFIRLLALYRSFQTVTFVWVKGHSGHSENENCDSLAVAMSTNAHINRIEDVGYKS
jgi:ribonuclease HI